MTAADRQLQRARGALYGLALGDAFGMPTQSMSRTQIAETYGVIDRLVDAARVQPIAAGRPAGSVTDDTAQALLVAQELVRGGGWIPPRVLADALLQWEQSMRNRGSLDLLGPSTRVAIQAYAAGAQIDDVGRTGATNGAAMRIAPVGIAYPPAPAANLLDIVVGVSKVTHNTGLAISGAAAVAGVVSAGIEAFAINDSIAFGLELADTARTRGHWFAGGAVADRTRWAMATTRGHNDAEFADFLERVVGTSVQTQESVVAALLITQRYRERPLAALTCAASIGGDTDTIASMAAAMLGAHLGVDAWPSEELAKVVHTSALELDPLVDALLALRGRD